MAPLPMRLLRARARFTSLDRPLPGRRAAPLLAAFVIALSAILSSPHSGLLRPDGGRALAACPSFQALVNAAPTGGTIVVPACTYHETVTISKRLTVNATGAVIDGDNARSKGLEIKANDVTVNGLTVQRIKNGAHEGAVHATSISRFTFRDGVVRDSATVCIVLGGGSGFRILSSRFTNCGQEGFFLNNVSDSLFRGNKIDHNHMKLAFASATESGGGKAMASARITFDRNEVSYNRGPGIWFDNSVVDVAATNNRVHHNDEDGIFFEISNGARIAGNSVWANGFGDPRWAYGAGITISSSDNAEVDHNTVAWNSRGISVISQSRGPQPHNGITVYANTVISQTADKVAGWYDDHGGSLYAAGNGNTGWSGRYWIGVAEPSSYRFEWAGDRKSVTSYNSTPGEEGAINLTAAKRDAALLAAGIPAGTMPTVVPPAPAKAPSVVLRGSVGATAPVRISWPATAGAIAYRLQSQRSGGSWKTVTLPSPTQTSVDMTLDAGRSYIFRLRMKLPASVWSNWVYTSVVKFN